MQHLTSIGLVLAQGEFTPRWHLPMSETFWLSQLSDGSEERGNVLLTDSG